MFSFDFWNVFSLTIETEAAKDDGEANFCLSNFGVALMSGGMIKQHPALISDFSAEASKIGDLLNLITGVALLSDYNASTHLLYISSCSSIGLYSREAPMNYCIGVY